MSIVNEIKAQIKALEEKLVAIQEACPHPDLVRTKEAQSNTGNWDIGSDRYWTNHYCGLCDKRWRVDT